MFYYSTIRSALSLIKLRYIIYWECLSCFAGFAVYSRAGNGSVGRGSVGQMGHNSGWVMGHIMLTHDQLPFKIVTHLTHWPTTHCLLCSAVKICAIVVCKAVIVHSVQKLHRVISEDAVRRQVRHISDSQCPWTRCLRNRHKNAAARMAPQPHQTTTSETSNRRLWYCRIVLPER